MSEFNMSSWMKKQYLAEAGLDTPVSKKLAKAMNVAMDEIDSEMSYKDFAVAVAMFLKMNMVVMFLICGWVFYTLN